MPRWTRHGAALAAATVLVGSALVPALTVASPAEAATQVTGVDVASWQHPNGKSTDINWTKVAAAGHSFAIIKATESTSYTNPYYAADVTNARAAGLVVGAYAFARPSLPLSSAAAQARYFVKAAGNLRTANTLPPILDIETNDGGLSKANLIAWTKSYLTTVQTLTGRTPMIYSYDSYLRSSLGNTTSLASFPLWYAWYSSKMNTSLPGGWNTWTLWQYTSGGSVSGISGRVDVNRFNGTLTSLKSLADGTKAAPIAPSAPTNLSATLAYPEATLTWGAPTSTGGTPVVNYVVSVDGAAVGTTPTRSFVAGPLSAGTHTLSVKAVNIAGTSSAATITVTLSSSSGGTTSPPPASTTLSLSTPTSAIRAVAQPVTVRLRRADTQQTLSAASVTIRVKSAGSVQYATLTTNTYGVASTTIKHNANDTVTASYAGTARLNPTSAVVSVKVDPRPIAALTSRTIWYRSSTTLTGRTSKLYQGEHVLRQEYYNGTWHNVAAGTVRADGTFAFKVAGSVKGTHTIRIHMYSSTLHIPGDSTTMHLRVRAR